MPSSRSFFADSEPIGSPCTPSVATSGRVRSRHHGWHKPSMHSVVHTTLQAPQFALSLPAVRVSQPSATELLQSP
jgi:hypothetical protein